MHIERMHRRRRPIRLLFLVAWFGISLVVTHASAANVAVEAILTDLHQPSGLAVRPGGTADRYEVFVADSGAGRVVRWSAVAPKQAVDVVTGFKTQAAADPLRHTGPRALYFLDPGLLVVGTTRDKDGDLLRLYELPDGDAALSADATTEPNSDGPAFDGVACTAIARSRANEFVPDLLFLVIRDADGRERLMKTRVQAGIIGGPKSFGPKDAREPRAITISNSGRVVVGDADGRLSFYNPIDGQIELEMPTDLKEPIGLAYNPATGSLYAADFAGGIYRIDDTSQPGHPECRTVKVTDVSQPTALAFAPDGSLYVVTYGNGNGDANGTLSVVTGDL